MTKAQKQRFLELKSLGVDMNESQQEEFDKLAEIAVKAGLDLETLQEVDQSSLTEAELSQVIKGCVQDELFGMSEQIQDRLENSATKEDLERAVKKYASEKINEDELVAKITKSLPKGESLNKEDLAEAFKSAIGALPLPSNHEYPVQKEEKMTIEVPFGNSKGNLTVASKQLLNVIQEKHINDGISESQLATAKANAHKVKSLQTTRTSSSGVDAGGFVVNTDISTQLEEAIYLESAVANAFRAQEIQMPTQNFEIPLVTTRPSFTLTAEGVSATESNPTLANRTLNSKKFTGLSTYSYELDDDAIIAILPMLQDQLAKGAADALEKAIISSQLLDGSGTSVANIFDMGLQGSAQGSSKQEDVGSAVFSGVTDHIANARGKMGVAGIKASELLLILTSKAYGEFLGDSSLTTFDKIGDQATLITGSVGQVYGVNVLVSDQFHSLNPTYTATGAFDSSTANLIHGLLCRPASFKLGVRGEFSVELDRNIKTQTNEVVASFRRAMNEMDNSTANAIQLIGA
jgi:HK97 family phage major capsid protein